MRARDGRRRIVRPDLVLEGAALVLTLAGLTLLLRRPTVSVVPLAPPSLALPATPTPILASDPAALDAIVRANPFSPTRTPPRTRYAPPDLASAATDDVDEGAAAEDVVEAAPLPQLLGTVVGPAAASALIAMDPASPAARLYRVGDRAGGWRVVRIGERSVVLDGPGGRVTLRLARPDAPPVPDEATAPVQWGSAGSRGDAEPRRTATAASAAALLRVSASPRELPSDSMSVPTQERP